MSQVRILLIYTGGTIGMVKNSKTGLLSPFNFENLYGSVPELNQLGYKIDCYSFENPIDSSNANTETWKELIDIIQENYQKYDGFVILHGSDTMAYTASALSFGILDLTKPVILTGSQLPIGTIRTDGKENLITAIEIAGAKENDQPIVPEVAIYFEYKLYRGNRTTKLSAEHFLAFESPNYELLAEAGVDLKYNLKAIQKNESSMPFFSPRFNANIGLVKLYPGITSDFLRAQFATKNLQGVVLETFGSGNAPNAKWFLDIIEEAAKKGILMLNISQCESGSVRQGKYETSASFNDIGVISGEDMTSEAAITKLMYALDNEADNDKKRAILTANLAGEISL